MKRYISVLNLLILVLITTFAFSSCLTAAQHHKELPQTQERELTTGIVQKEIREDMTQAEVAESLGSPNIVTRDENGLETWIYDKVASEASYSRSSTNTGILSIIIGYAKEAGSSSTTQKTLTVIIKFKDNRVDSFSYHSSKF